MSELSTIVQRRLDALGISPYQASKRAGLDRSFVADLVKGRKKSVSHDQLPLLASALECTVSELAGGIVQAPLGSALGKMEISGIVEAGVWREISATPSLPALPRLHDARLSPDSERLFLVRGHDGDHLGIHDGMVLLCGDWPILRSAGHELQTRDLVVVRRRKPGNDAISLSVKQVRRVRGGIELTDGEAPITLAEEQILHDDGPVVIAAVVMSAVRVFGEA